MLTQLDFVVESHVSFHSVLEVLSQQGVLFSTDRVLKHNHSQQTISLKVLQAVDKCIELMTILILQSSDAYFCGQNQYTVACAVIAASRRHCRVTVPSVWPEEL